MPVSNMATAYSTNGQCHIKTKVILFLTGSISASFSDHVIE